MNKLNNHTDLGDVLIRSDLNVPMINNEITDNLEFLNQSTLLIVFMNPQEQLLLQVILVDRIIVTQISHLLK